MTSPRSRESLTPRQNEIFEFIRTCIQERNTPPTIMEIGAEFNIHSPNGVSDLLLVLERKGYIVRRRGQARGISLAGPAAGDTGGKRVARIPIVGDGDASNPFSIFMNPRGTMAPDPELFPIADSFAAIVPDDAMDGDGVYKGDYVIVRQRDDLPSGKMVFALVDNRSMVRRLQDGDVRSLAASNRYYPPIIVTTGGATVAILGEVVGLIRTFRER